MSMPRKETVSCPRCGRSIEFTQWDSINDEWPHAMEDVISGELFMIKCGHCGLRTRVNYPILVNDMEHGVMVQYVHTKDTHEAERVFKALRRMYDGRRRIVTEQNSLIEKVGIFHAGLDDRVVELLKAVVMSQARDQLRSKEVQGVYFVPGDRPRFEVIYKGGEGHIPVDMHSYEKIKELFTAADLLKEDQEFYVDRQWALSILGQFELGGEG